MPYMQCPYCDSVNVIRFYANMYKCETCGRLFNHFESEDTVVVQ
ncbi:MAG: hypothetical protein ACOC32_03745 [Nanoarchaeota archaeon]